MIRETPEPANAGTPSETALVDTTWAVRFRETTARQLRDAEITWREANVLDAMADFGEKHDCTPAATDVYVDWFGFGSVKPIFESTSGGYWMSLFDLIAVTGLEYSALHEQFEEDRVDDGNGDADLMRWVVTEDGETNQLPLVKHSFAMRAMLAGPWSREFMENTMNLFRHAAVHSGLADAIGPVVQQNADGVFVQTDMSLGDFLAQGDRLPSEQDARAEAMRGPAVDL